MSISSLVLFVAEWCCRGRSLPFFTSTRYRYHLGQRAASFVSIIRLAFPPGSKRLYIETGRNLITLGPEVRALALYNISYQHQLAPSTFSPPVSLSLLSSTAARQLISHVRTLPTNYVTGTHTCRQRSDLKLEGRK